MIENIVIKNSVSSTMRRAHRVLLAAFVALLGACTLAPHYQVPSVPDATFKEAGDWLPAVPADTQARGAWWENFAEPKLNELQQQLPAGNQDLQAASARYQQARALTRQSFSAIFPTLDADGSVSRARSSANAPRSAGVSTTGNDFNASLNFAWEIDLFGRLRSAAYAAQNRAQASSADVAAVTLALHAELATDYFSLRGADATALLLADTVAAYERALTLTRNRYEGGIAAATDVDQAETQLQNARAQLASIRLQRAQLEHAIAILLGVPPSGFSLEPAPLLSEPPPVDVGLSSTLLQRRPDIARAERTVAAANAEIGVARAAWFPVFKLGAVGGYEATTSPAWLDAPSRFWSVGPSGVLPLLDAGARLGATRQAHAVYDEAVANYRQASLIAYREVEDNLAALHHLADAQTADDAAAASAQRSVYHANERYSAGVADYIEVTTTQTAALQAQRAALDARVQRLNATVALVRALGGGWSGDGTAMP